MGAALERDEAPRELELPNAFAALCLTRRREHSTRIAEAKKAETRDRRAAKTVEVLLAAVKHP